MKQVITDSIECFGIEFDALEVEYIEEIKTYFGGNVKHVVILKDNDSNELTVLFMLNNSEIKRMTFDNKIELFKALT